MKKTEEEVKAYKQAYREAHREEMRQYSKQRYQARKEELLAKQKAYRDAHPGINSAHSKRWREENPEKWKDGAKAYYQKNKEKILEQTHARYDSDKNRDQKILKAYRLTRAQWDELYRSQNGLCAICHNPPKEGEKLKTDHCHTTGIVRGLLCSSCNTALGHFQDNTEYLRSAIEYLAAFGTLQS